MTYTSDDGEVWGYEEERDSRNDYLREQEQPQPQPNQEEMIEAIFPKIEKTYTATKCEMCGAPNLPIDVMKDAIDFSRQEPGVSIVEIGKLFRERFDEHELLALVFELNREKLDPMTPNLINGSKED